MAAAFTKSRRVSFFVMRTSLVVKREANGSLQHIEPRRECKEERKR
jgi:hypothetical protein